MSDHEKSSFHDINLKQYIADLKAPWSTMAPDMDTAIEVINRYAKVDEIDLLSIDDSESGAQIRFPDWQSEIERIYILQYGLADGRRVFKKVIMRLYQLSKGSAQQLH